MWLKVIFSSNFNDATDVLYVAFTETTLCSVHEDVSFAVRLLDAGRLGAIVIFLFSISNSFNMLLIPFESMSRHCEKVISYPILGQILFSSMVLCFSIYRLQAISFVETPFDFLSIFQYMWVMAAQIYLPCHYCNELTLQSAALHTAIYNCNWIAMTAAELARFANLASRVAPDPEPASEPTISRPDVPGEQAVFKDSSDGERTQIAGTSLTTFDTTVTDLVPSNTKESPVTDGKAHPADFAAGYAL
uniref:Odorant receptor n=1 Tax=Glossina austeni TaxID=7395 RepID=A0A1A9UHW0_GLOAU